MPKPREPDYSDNPFMGWGYTRQTRHAAVNAFMGTKYMFHTAQNTEPDLSVFAVDQQPAAAPSAPRNPQRAPTPSYQQIPAQETKTPEAANKRTFAEPSMSEGAPGPRPKEGKVSASDYLQTDGTRRKDNRWGL